MIGSIILTLALASSIIAMIMFYLSYRGYNNTLNIGRIAYHSMAMLVIVASTILWYALLNHQYEYKYVYSYSANSLSTGFLLASFWGGQEGSFMLWLLLTSIVGIILQSYSSKRGDLEPRVMAVFTLATSFLLVMVSPLFKNPFASIWAEPVFLNAKSINPAYFGMPFLQSFMFSDGSSGQNFVKMSAELVAVLKGAGISLNQFIIDGKGLNPQLLNFWMQIHPPILFIGFSMATVPFSFAIAALMKNDYKDWVKQSLPWVLAGSGILGLGIMLGGYWAYEMLGWGGYWAWDPVENSSLIPWLVGVASIHTMLVQKKSQSKGGPGKYIKTNLMLSMMTYILVLYSTFLTRSGVLGDASVHSFVDPGMLVYLFLVIFISSFILLGVGMIVYRWKTLSQEPPADESILSRELALFTAAIVLCASAVIVLVGTSAPIFGQAVDTFFYNEMHLPLAIIIGLLNGVSLLIKWKQSTTQELIKKSIISVAASILFTVILVIAGLTDLMMIILAFATSFSLLVNLEIAVKIIRGNLKMLGAYVSHIGIALFILGVIGSAFGSDEVDIDLIKNQPKEAFGYEMTFTGIEPIENNTKYAFHINLKEGDKNHTISPVMYISDFNNGLMREPAILSMLTRDVYLSPLGYEEGGDDGHNHGGSTVTLEKGGTTEFNDVKINFNEFLISGETMTAMQTGQDFEMGAALTAEKDGKKKEFKLKLISKQGNRELTSESFPDLNMKIELVNLQAGNIQVALSALDNSQPETTAPKQEVLSVTASIKPYIGLVWIGVLVMFLGFLVSVARRLKESLV
ncbi:MAG: cytochrome c biogenesis protein CcsA [Ignavibacteriales bacterium]|nr:MAG: cytochrome c biogenesis protein CcsA [Ignavibacteriales bacterium]